eukprot:5398468-Pyramimonas_sp.AAC.1
MRRSSYALSTLTSQRLLLNHVSTTRPGTITGHKKRNLAIVRAVPNARSTARRSLADPECPWSIGDLEEILGSLLGGNPNGHGALGDLPAVTPRLL